MIRILVPGDEGALERFLVKHADSSLFLRSNVLAAGLLDHGAPLQATYAAAWRDHDIVAVAAHCWNDNLLLQAPVETAAVARAAVQHSGRAVQGLLGPWDQIESARDALGLSSRDAMKHNREDLFALRLADLVVPALLAHHEVRCRRSEAADLDLLADWRVAYAREALREPDHPLLYDSARADMQRWHDERRSWVLEAEGRLVSYSGFNARLPDTVQIGGVFTPPEYRNRGYGRAVVAGSLLDARAEGVDRSILFAEAPAAKQAYRALGFLLVGDYGMMLFPPATFRPSSTSD